MKFGAASFEPYVSIEGPGARIHRDSSKTPNTPTREESVDSGEPLTIDGVMFPREASARIRAFSAEERTAWDDARFRCRTDQLFLSDILGLDLVENPHRALFNLFLHKKPGRRWRNRTRSRKREWCSGPEAAQRPSQSGSRRPNSF